MDPSADVKKFLLLFTVSLFVCAFLLLGTVYCLSFPRDFAHPFVVE